MRYFSWFLGVLLSINVVAQAPKYSNEFLNIGVGARSLGMSNSVVANVDDVTAGYWNPAGLTRLQPDFQVSLMHAEYFAGIAKYDYGAFATKVDSLSTVGLSIIRFGVDDIPNTTELIDADGNINYDRIKSFSAADYGILFSYARKMPIEGLDVGANVKIVHRSVGEFARAWGFGIDLGAQYQVKEWRFGAMFRDITTTFNAWSYSLTDEVKAVFVATGNELPQNGLEITLPKLLLGGSRQFDLGKKFLLNTEVDLDMTFDGKRNVAIRSQFVSIDPHFGLEASYNNLIFLRAGIGNVQEVRDLDGFNVVTFQPNMGIGIQFKGIALDYALTDIGDQSVALYSNVFSLRFDINRTAK